MGRGERVPELPRKRLPVGDIGPRSAYDGCNRERDDGKRPHRQWVQDFIIAHHAPIPAAFSTEPGLPSATLFSFPGENWSFEIALARAWAVPMFNVAIEWRTRSALRSAMHMPGDGLHTVKVPVGPGTVEGWRTSSARLLNMSARDFFTIELYGEWKRRQRWHWEAQYKRWTCAWMDFTSPLGAEVITAMGHLHSHVSNRREKTPVAVSFMVGREDAETTLRLASHSGDEYERRVSLAAEVLGQSATRPFELLSQTVTRSGRVNMLTVAGVIRPSDYVKPKQVRSEVFSCQGVSMPRPTVTSGRRTISRDCGRDGPYPLYEEAKVLAVLARGGKLLAGYSPLPTLLLEDREGFRGKVSGGHIPLSIEPFAAERWVTSGGFTDDGFEVFTISDEGRAALRCRGLQAGQATPPSPLTELRRSWQNAGPAHREEFLKEVGQASLPAPADGR